MMQTLPQENEKNIQSKLHKYKYQKNKYSTSLYNRSTVKIIVQLN